MQPSPGKDSPKPPQQPTPNADYEAPDPREYTAPFLQAPQPVKDMAYGGTNGAGLPTLQAAQIHRLERGFPAFRRGRLVPSIPRTKAETLYARDPNQTMVNPVLNTGAVGAATSGTASPGTTNAPNTVTGAVVRYRTPYKTNLQ
jgi:hypothetical protein